MPPISASASPSTHSLVSTDSILPPSLPPGDLRETLRQESRRSLYFFCKSILGFKDFVPHVHGPACMMLEDWSAKRLGIMLPRSFFKSTLVSIGYAIWESIQIADAKTGRPGSNVRVLIAQNTSDNALKKLAAIKSQWDGNKLLRTLFPELLPTTKSRWTSECLQLNRTSTDPEGTYEAVGIGTQVVSRHFDIIIEDDTVAPDLDELGEDNLCPTKDDIDQAIGWHKLLTPLFVHPAQSRSLIVGTRWFEKDLISHVQLKERIYRWYQRSAIEADLPIWPERFGHETLSNLRASLGPYMFACLYLNDPMRSQDMVFQPEWWRFYETEPRDLIVYTTVDPAGDPKLAKKRKNDFSVVMTCGKDIYTGNIYVLHYDRLRGNPGEVIEAIFRHVRNYKPVKVAIESNAYQGTLVYWVNERKKKESLHFFVEPINSRRSKEERIRGLQPVFADGRLFVRMWMQDLLTELLAFPLGANDDIADALAMQLGLWATTRSLEERKRDTSATDPLSFAGAIADIRHRQREELRGQRSNQTLDIIAKPGMQRLNLITNDVLVGAS